MDRRAAMAALEWHLDQGVDELLSDEPQDCSQPLEVAPSLAPTSNQPTIQSSHPPAPAMGAHEGRQEAASLAAKCQSLQDLEQAIKDFDGIGLKKTAHRCVFADGNPKAPIMLIGEAPGADEDREGKPFMGQAGVLQDKILATIGISRESEDPAHSVYLTNILNWRPPGNRTPSPAEIEMSLPFIEKHIQLVRPKLLILCGGVAAKALLGSGDSISRLRNIWHEYKVLTPELKASDLSIPAIATYHPSYLLRTPPQKKAVWADVLNLQRRRAEMSLL